MTVVIKGHDLIYEIESVARIFIGPEKIVFAESAPEGEDVLIAAAEDNEKGIGISVSLDFHGKTASETDVADKNCGDSELELKLCIAVYKCFSRITGETFPWGVMTGIRPVKLVRKERENGRTDEDIAREFKEKYLISDEKMRLLSETERYETEIIKSSGKRAFSLYIGIPFCPTRCRYCSFVCSSVEKTKKLIPGYVDALVKEIDFTADLVKKIGLDLETVYMGGGTPTTLSAEQLRRVLTEVNERFCFGKVREYTVEAGRPDTVTREKLEVLKRCGVGRISVNPQTMNDEILEAVGRRHTSRQTLEAYELAREVGFDCINMDVIAGLPGESVESFRNTIDTLTAISPENITVHTLAIKRSADMSQKGGELFSEGGKRAAEMLGYSAEKLAETGYHPYYLYRQKNMLGNLENIGYSKPGKDGLYNVYIMDETHSIFSVGAGGVTKLREPDGDRIERIFNYKFPYEYIERFEELLKRKKKAEEFYEKTFSEKSRP